MELKGSVFCTGIKIFRVEPQSGHKFTRGT
uniref:Uncharacterized protein n=1 Tax=Rhizophora mucronata TaxID=61149 RepID=A0A2P2N022_RHIMU